MTREDFCKRCSRYAGCGFISRNLQRKCDILQIFEEGYEQGYEDTKNYPRWISVVDELPKEHFKDSSSKWVLVCTPLGSVYIDSYNHKKKEWVNNRKSVTHWMSLPEAPKKGGNNE